MVAEASAMAFHSSISRDFILFRVAQGFVKILSVALKGEHNVHCRSVSSRPLIKSALSPACDMAARVFCDLSAISKARCLKV